MQTDCPVNGIFPRFSLYIPHSPKYEVLFAALEVQPDALHPVYLSSCVVQALLHASLDRNSLSVQKFSRWLRGTCTILLCRNTSADRLKAVGYVEQAIAVMDDNNETRDEVSDVSPQGHG
jgi:hypothetical protein